MKRWNKLFASKEPSEYVNVTDDGVDMQGDPAYVLLLPLLWAYGEPRPQILIGMREGRLSVCRGSLTAQERQAELPDDRGRKTKPGSLHAKHYFFAARRIGGNDLVSPTRQYSIDYDFSASNYVNPIWELGMISVKKRGDKAVTVGLPCAAFGYFMYQDKADGLAYRWAENSGYLPMEQLLKTCARTPKQIDPMLCCFLEPYTEEPSGAVRLGNLLDGARRAYESEREATEIALEKDLNSRY